MLIPSGFSWIPKLLIVLACCVPPLYFCLSRLTTPSSSSSPSSLYCPISPLSNDVQLVLKTTATEVLSNLPVHLETTLRCVPNYLIYSDHAESLAGIPIHDALSSLPNILNSPRPEFALHNHLHAHGRAGLNTTTPLNTTSARTLAKWKTIPTLHDVLHRRPTAKWFVFIDLDTYIVWPNLLAYLARFDARKPWYITQRAHRGTRPQVFANSGAGYALSAPAVRKMLAHVRAHRKSFEKLIESEWGADVLLYQALKDVGVELFSAFPHFQGAAPPGLDLNATQIGRRPWCYAPVSYGHMRPEERRALWEFEQEWDRRHEGSGRVLRHRDVFKGLVLPQIPAVRRGWDNMVGWRTEYSEEVFRQLTYKEWWNLEQEEQEAYFSFSQCRALCESLASCRQYAYAVGRCDISGGLTLGYEREKGETWDDSQMPEITSGWVMKRLPEYVEKMDSSCEGEDGNGWVTT
ncbi:uncharacterized protein BDZ99DRAFT_443269 [Mytilinidion resinicola]|uniref:N-acetylgalactosaminide beta-1,3-galactosyltransferase n=1 Tax=Mytilinidion resinicola TaxID=574789 RepID=A0A6A6YNJ9_9PEZI|nr:uncharacterized protein BDZ99DRAFT_443269 [Mytilinidion resinicola]KAF2810466.1 hypothetical protein BDZ99DRAFT_443269 [Mytilinidion resinicola]